MKIGVKLGLEIQNLYSKRLWMPSEWVRSEKNENSTTLSRKPD